MNFSANRINYLPADYYDPRIIFMNDNQKNNTEKNEDANPDKNILKHLSLNVILADDDEDDRDLFKEAVDSAGMNIDLNFAEDGRCLIDLLNDKKDLPDLIFLDLNMPHKSGIECLVEIRKNPRLKNIPIVIYSTSSSNRDIDETYDKGANLYVRKPSSFNDLTIITKKVLSLDWTKFKPYGSRAQFLYSSKTE